MDGIERSVWNPLQSLARCEGAAGTPYGHRGAPLGSWRELQGRRCRRHCRDAAARSHHRLV